LAYVAGKNSICGNLEQKIIESEGGETVEKRKLELAFIDKNGKVYPIDKVTRAELAEGLEKISKEIAKRLLLLKEQR
jgi:hypothetical protein